MNNKLIFTIFILPIVFFGCVSSPENSGLDLSSATGQIIDVANMPISKAKLTFTPGGYTTTTDEKGFFYLSNVAPGIYQVKIEKDYPRITFSPLNDLIVKKDRLGSITIPAAVYVLVEAGGYLDHDFYISLYELTDVENIATFHEPVILPPLSYPTCMEFTENNFPLRSIINNRSSRDGLTPCFEDKSQPFDLNISANGYRLPTSEEWLFACKGGKLSKNYTFSGSNNPNEVAWYLGNSSSSYHPVGQKKPNELGIYDMNGNISELCYYKSSNSYQLKSIGGGISNNISEMFSMGPVPAKTGIRLVRTAK